MAPASPISKASSFSMSPWFNSNPYTSAFSLIRLSVSLFGSGTQFFCKQYRIKTCAVVLLCAFASERRVESLALWLRTSGE